MDELFLGWILGFITSYAVYVPEKSYVSEIAKDKPIASWVDSFCDQHPEESLAHAADFILLQLRNSPH